MARIYSQGLPALPVPEQISCIPDSFPLNRHTLPSHHAGGTVSIYNPALLSSYLLSRSQGHIRSKEVVFKLPHNYSFIRAAAKPALHRSTEEAAIMSLDQSPK